MSVFKAYDIRGIYGTEITEALYEKIGRALVTFLKPKKVVIGHDMRPHSIPLFAAIARGITAQGADVIDIGLSSTPMSYFANGTLQADASVIITASHNPGEYNGMKICRENAIPVSGATGIKEIERLVNENNFPVSETTGQIIKADISQAYANTMLPHATFTRKPRIVVDFANAMGSKEIEGIRQLFDIIPLYEELDGSFPNHEANPLQLDTLDELCAKVKEINAEFGVAYDGDADRSGFVDDEGVILPMDLTTALIAEDILSNGPATILYDLRSSWTVKETIEKNGGTAIMSRVGHSFIKAQMRQHGAIFAGELSGHYYFQENFTAESQSLALILVANVLEKSGKKMSDLVRPLRKYHASGEINSKVADAGKVLDILREKYHDGKQFELDGLSVEYKEWWFNVRSSNTEPLLRLICEAKTAEQMAEKRDELLAIIRAK